MSNHYIATKLHQLQLNDPRYPGLNPYAWIEKVPHYVIDESLLDLMERSDVKASIAAMIEAEICHLPFPTMMIEMPVAGGEIHCFVGLIEHPNGIAGHLVMFDQKDHSVGAHPNAFNFRPDASGTLVFQKAAGREQFSPPDYSGPQLRDELGVGVRNLIRQTRTMAGKHTTGPEEMLAAGTVHIAIQLALLMLNIQGVGKEVIEPTRLNRGRVATGKPPIPKHTVMRIAHVYDRDGKREAVGSHKRTKAVHMRSGYTRRQHYGVGNAETKIVYIPPVLVNFRPGVGVPVPRRVIAA